MRVRAISTMRCWPKDSALPGRSANSAKPTKSSASRARAASSASSARMRLVWSAAPKRPARAAQVQPGHHVLEDRHAGEKLRGLEGARQPHAGDPVGLHAGDHAILETDVAGIGLVHAADDVEQRRLAGAVRPDDADDLAGAERGRYAVERAHAAERDRDASTARMLMPAPLPACSLGGRAVERSRRVRAPRRPVCEDAAAPPSPAASAS